MKNMLNKLETIKNIRWNEKLMILQVFLIIIEARLRWQQLLKQAVLSS
jgi:hypothetical protein